jgi:Domain of Unknown Function (DUF748)
MSGTARSALRTLAMGLRQLLAVRWVRVLAVLLLLLAAGRLGLNLLLASVVSRLAAERHLDVAWEDLDLRLRGGSGKVEWLTVAPLDAAGKRGPPLLEIEYAVFDLDVLALLKGELSIRRAEVDGADLRLEREPDGKWSFERHLAIAEMLSLVEGAPADELTQPHATEPVEPKPIVLAPPLVLEALRLQNARLKILDRTFEPARELDLETNAWLTSLGRASQRPTRFGLELYGADMLDAAHLEGEARWNETGVELSLRAQGGALRPRALADYLEPLRIRPIADAVYGGLHADVSVSVVGERRDALAAQIAITDARLSADGGGTFNLDRLALEIGSTSGERTSVHALEVSGARGAVELSPERALRVAGFELLAPEREPRPPATWEDIVASVLDLAEPGKLPGWIALLGRADPEAYPWTLERAAFADCSFEVLDRGVEPPARFALKLEQAELTCLEHDPALQPQPAGLSAKMSAPGLANSIEVSASVQPWAPHRKLELALDVQGISPASADAYLEGAGLERTLADGRLRLALNAAADEDGGVTRAWLEAREMALEDSGELLGVREVALRDIVLDPAARKLRLGEMVVSGPRLAFVRDPSQSLLALGMRTSPQPHPTVADGTATQPQAQAVAHSARAVAAPVRAPVSLEIGRAAWLDSRITFEDESVDPPASFAVDELGLELRDLVLSNDPAAPAPPPATLFGRLRAEGVARELKLSGLVRSSPGASELEAELELEGHGLRGALLGHYLAPLGITPLIEDGELRMKARAALQPSEQGPTFSLAIADARLSDGGVALLGADAIALEGLRFGAQGVEIGRGRIERPFARVGRDRRGGLVLSGVRVEAQQASAPQTSQPTSLPWPALPPLRAGELSVAGAVVAFSDSSFDPPLDLELECDAALRDFAADGRRSELEVQLAVPGVVEHIALRGGIAATPTTFDVDLELDAAGIQAGPLAELMPAGLDFERPDGRLRARVDAVLGRAESGAERSARVEISGVRWGADEDQPWLALDSFLLDVPRFDPLSRELEIAALRTEGLELALRRDADGALCVLGMRYAPGSPRPERAIAIEASAPNDAQPTQPSRPESALQRLTLGDVHLAIDQVSFQDETLGVNARPLVASLALDVDPCAAITPDPAQLPPVLCRVSASVDGLLERANVEGRMTLFAEEPRIEAELQASGVRTAGLIECLPTLASRMRGEVENGELSGKLEAVLSVRRSHPTDLALDKPFGGELRLTDLAYRAAPGGDVLLGVDAVEIQAKQIDPRRGAVHLEQIAVRTPRARLERTADAAHAAGFAIALAGPAAAPAPSQAKQLAPPANPVDPAAVEEPPDLRVDRIEVSGLDVRIVDRSVEPPLEVELDRLELESSRISTRDLAHGGAVSFSGELGAKLEPSGADVFDELTLAGRIAPLPVPVGWVQMNLSGFELVPLAPLASTKGLTLEDGALDLSARVRLKGKEGAGAGVSVTFSDLNVSEPEGGFLQKLLSLPMTLDTALFLLRNPAGEHRFSVDVAVGPEGVGTGALAMAAASAAVQVIAAAVAGAPLRLIGAVLPGGDGKAEPAREVLVFDFPPGSAELDEASRHRLEELALRVRVQPALNVLVRQELSSEDLECARRLANPAPEQCLELTAGLRQRKASLWRDRDAAAAQARAMFAIGASGAREASERVRALEGQLAEVEAGLDRVLEVLRAGSPRQQAKRARTTARELAELRLEEVASAVRRELEGRQPERIEVRSPRSSDARGEAAGRVIVELIRR